MYLTLKAPVIVLIILYLVSSKAPGLIKLFTFLESPFNLKRFIWKKYLIAFDLHYGVFILMVKFAVAFKL